jgi:hypothetical protein
MAWQSGAGGSGAGGMVTGEPSGVQAYTLQGTASFNPRNEPPLTNHYRCYAIPAN